MKTIHYFLSAAFLFVSSIIMAQTANVVIFSEDADQFYVLVNGVHQNKEARANVKLTQMPVAAYKVKVIFQDNSLKPLEKTVYPEADQEYTMNVKRSKKGELKMTLFSVVAITNSNQPGQYVHVYGTVDNSQPLQNGTTVATSQPTQNNNDVVNTNNNSNVTTTTTTTTNSSNTNVVVSDPNMPNNANVNVNTNVVENPNGANVNTTIGDGQNMLNLNISVSETGMNMNINETHSDPNVRNNNANVNVNTNIGNSATTANNTYTETTTVTTTTKVNGQVVDHNSTTTQVNNQNGNVNSNATTNSNVVNNNASNTNTMPASAAPCYEMNSSDFAKAKASVKAKDFDDSRLSIAKQVIDKNCLSTDQIKQLVELFSFEETNLSFAKMAYSRCSDPQNYYQINDVFDFDASTEELEAYIKGK